MQPRFNEANLNNLQGRLESAQNAYEEAEGDAIRNAPGTPTLDTKVTFENEYGQQIGDARYIQRTPGKYANLDIYNPNYTVAGENYVTGGVIPETQQYATNYNPTTGQIVYRVPKSIADTSQWQGFVSSVNSALAGKDLATATSYLDSEEYKNAYTAALTNADTVVHQMGSLMTNLGRDATEHMANIYGASSTMASDDGKIRNGAYLYVPVVADDGTITWQQQDVSGGISVKDLTKIIPGFILRSTEYIDSTAGQFAQTGAGLGNLLEKPTIIAGTALGHPVAATAVAESLPVVFSAMGYLMGDEDGHVEQRFTEVLKMLDEKGDTNIMDLSQDEKAELYAAVSYAAGRLQNMADKGIRLSDDLATYYSGLTGLQTSLDQLGFSHMSDLTNARNSVENFVRQTLNAQGQGLNGFLSGAAMAQAALNGEDVWSAAGRLSAGMTATGEDTYSSPAELMFAPRTADGVVGDRGALGIIADIALGIASDPAGSVQDSLRAMGMNPARVAAYSAVASIMDDGGLSLIGIGVGQVGRRLRSARDAIRAANSAENALGQANNVVTKQILHSAADGADASLTREFDDMVDAASDSMSKTGDDTIQGAYREAGSNAVDQLEDAGRRMSVDDVNRNAGRDLTNGGVLDSTEVKAANEAVDTASNRILQTIRNVSNMASGLGRKVANAFTAPTADFAEDVARLAGQAGGTLSQTARGRVFQATLQESAKQVLRSMPMNTVVALANMSQEMASRIASGEDVEGSDYWKSFLNNLGWTMLFSSTPAAIRTNSQFFDWMTDGGVTKLREKANQYATKISTIPATISRNAPVFKQIRNKMQKYADADARQLNEMRYQANRARGRGEISYDEWIHAMNITSNREFGTRQMRLSQEFGLDKLHAIDNELMRFLGGRTKTGRATSILSGKWDNARNLLNEFINCDEAYLRATGVAPEIPFAGDDSPIAQLKKRRDDALRKMDAIVEENGGNVDEFHKMLYGDSLDGEPLSVAGGQDNSYRGQLRQFYHKRASYMAAQGITSQEQLDILRSDPRFKDTYIRLRVADGKTAEEVATEVERYFYTVSNKPNHKSVVQEIKDVTGSADRAYSDPLGLAETSVADVANVSLMNDRNKLMVDLSNRMNVKGTGFCEEVADPNVMQRQEQEIISHDDFLSSTSDIYENAFGRTVGQTGPRGDLETNALNEIFENIQNSDYIAQQASLTGFTPEELTRSFMSAYKDNIVAVYKKVRQKEGGDIFAREASGQFRKKLNSWMSGEDMTVQDVRAREQERRQRTAPYTNTSDEDLYRMLNDPVVKPSSKWSIQLEITRRQSRTVGQPTEMPETTYNGTSQEFVENTAKAIYSTAKTIGSQETLDSVNPTGSVSADYTPEKRATARLGKNMTTLAETAGKSPSDTITVYRGVPKGVNKIVAGDFVTTNKQLAQDYAGNGRVVSRKVKYGDIIDDRTEPLGEEYIYRPGASSGEQLSLFSAPNALPEGYRNWRDTFVAENGTEPTLDDVNQQVTMELQGKRKLQLCSQADRADYRAVVARENNLGVVSDEYLAQHRKALHFGSKVSDDRAKEMMSFIPNNGIELAEDKTSAPTLAQVKSAAMYTGQGTSAKLSSDVVEALRRRGTKQTTASQSRAFSSFMTEDAIVDTDGSFYSELNKTNQKKYLNLLTTRTQAAVGSVGGVLRIPAGLQGQELAAYLGKQLRRARVAQEIATNPKRYNKSTLRFARDEDGKAIKGSGKYYTHPERLVIRSKATNTFDKFSKWSDQSIYKTNDQRHSTFNANDEVYIGSATVLHANDPEDVKKLVSSLKRTFTDPAMRNEINLLEQRADRLTRNSFDDLPMIQEAINSAYGIDAIRYSSDSGDTVLLFNEKPLEQGGWWDTKATYSDVSQQDIHDFDATADLWNQSVKSKTADTRQSLRQEEADIKAANGAPNFTYYENGRKHVYKITSPAMAATFKTVSVSTAKSTMGVVTQFFNRMSRAFRQFTTGALNPAYIATNYVRDLQTATITAGSNAFGRRFAQDLYSSILKSVAPDIPDAQAEEIASRLQAGYRGTAYNAAEAEALFSRSPHQQSKILKRMAREQNGGIRNVGRHFESMESMMDWLGKASDNIEYLRRGTIADNAYGQYIMRHLPEYLDNPTPEARQRLIDGAVDYATMYSANATTDFSYRTQYLSNFMSTIPYMRTSFSSARSFGRMFLADPLGFLTRVIALGIAPYASNLMANISDDDKAAVYENIPEYERAQNWIIVNGDGTYMSVPIPQEIEFILSPIRAAIEQNYDIKNSGIIEGLIGGLATYSPVDFSGFCQRDINGDIDTTLGLQRMLGSVTPQFLSPIIEAALNRDLYTGSPLNPTVDDLVRQGAKLNKDGTVDPASLTFASRNSRSLGAIANATGLSQGAVQNFVSNYMGTFGQYAVSAVDSLLGAPSDQVGGTDMATYAAQRFFNNTPSGADSAWNEGISKLYDQRDLLIETIDSDASIDEKNEIIREFTQQVVEFANAYTDYYTYAGGLTDAQRNQMIGLLNFYKSGITTTGVRDAAEADISMNEYSAAQQRAMEAGLIPATGLASDLYGRMNAEGEITYTTPAMRALQNRVYGTPEEAGYRMTQALDADEGGGTMKDLKSAVYDALDPYYERIAAGEQLTDDEYNEMDAIRKAYMDEFYRRIDPIIEQYGATILNNDDIIEALNDYTITTSDDWQESIPQYSKKGKEYHKYISSKLFPNATADVQQILLEHYGMGGRNTSNLQTSKRADDLIRVLQEATANGEMGKAQDYQRLLFTGIQNGSLYVSDRDMSQLGI